MEANSVPNRKMPLELDGNCKREIGGGAHDTQKNNVHAFDLPAVVAV